MRKRRDSLDNRPCLLGNITFALVLVLVTSCSGDRASTEDVPLYLGESGEEVYGPDYRPMSPDIPSVPLLIGTPGAGTAVPAELRGAEQLQLLGGASPVTDEPQIESGQVLRLPLLKSHSNRIPLNEALTRAPLESLGIQSGDATDSDPLENGAEDGQVPKMTAHFVFVGQGDGAILEFPCGVAVIDTGGEFGGADRENGGELFVEYLTEFFADRPHFENTIDVLFTTHPHADHLNGLPLLVDASGTPIFKIKNVVDNGQTGDSGSLKKQKDFRDAVVANSGKYSAVELARQVSATGATNDVIDPLDCDAVDPIITAFWGGLNEALPADDLLATSEYSSPNNHSVVIRIDFGAASFLFTGDLEDKGEEDFREQYEDNIGVFDVDIYQVSHHGADDDTSNELLTIMSPDIAVISMGDPDLQKTFTAWDHGHPRTGLLAVLQNAPGVVVDERDPAETFLAAPAQESDFENTLIERAIFGTGWEGNITIEADSLGIYEIAVE